MSCTKAEGLGAGQLAGGGNWERGGSRANLLPEDHSSQGVPEAGERHKGACCSCCTKPGGQGQGAWVGRLSELMRCLRTPQMKQWRERVSRNSEPVQMRCENAEARKF
eukprot:1147091-Pelagomonas_calceolata.AAC.3